MGIGDTDKGIGWISRFQATDQSCATELINSIVEVSYNDFMNDLTSLIVARSKQVEGPIGLYAEREVKGRLGVPNRLFKESRRKPKRAYGSSIPPVLPTRPYAPEVGSEGLIAHIITEICRRHRKLFINHPGPDRIRKDHIRNFFLITDLIGSGDRAWKYLEAAWRVSSVRSWHSLKLLNFEVIAYSATILGEKRIKRHPCRPSVFYVQPCPTIDTTFPKDVANRIKALCIKYDPIDHDVVRSLGHGGTGALLVFAHGAPNNSPRIFYKNTKKWIPLFPSRVTAEFRSKFEKDYSLKTITKKMERMKQTRLSKSLYLITAHPDARLLILVLAALTRGPRFDDALCTKTGLTIPEIKKLRGQLHSFAWIDANQHVTDEGYRQLDYAKLWQPSRFTVDFEVGESYYPQMLRAPRSSS